MVQLKEEIDNFKESNDERFQYLYGAVKSKDVKQALTVWFKFQYLYGAVKSRYTGDQCY